MSQFPSSKGFQERLKTVPLADLIPYWRNPRRITDEAVNAVAKSLEEYGYQQPIVVDDKNVIIIGHTRYAAMRRMGVTEVQVLVETDLSQTKIKQLRTIDNRTSEYAFWDFEKLVAELENLDSELMTVFFPEVSGSFEEPELDEEGFVEIPEVVDLGETADTSAEFVCPSCFHMWVKQVTREELLAGKVDK